MSEIEIVNAKNLLSQVAIIKKKYDDFAEYTGENYNIFNVLGIYQDELSHSALIGDLLNTKGRHGQKDTFLKLFLDEINGFEKNTEQLNVLDNFKSANSCAHLEKNLGKVDNENGEGGRIDILINDGKSNIIIENKIGAGDQNQQLLRYNKFDTNAPLLYLTLEGNEPSIYSISDKNNENRLSLGKDFVCISYRTNIVNWLENCIKEMANKPIIRESLNQYLVLVKQLTHQSNNNKMKEEIEKIIFNNEESFNIWQNLINSSGAIIEQAIEKKVKIILEEVKDELSIIFHDADIKICEKLNSSNWLNLIEIRTESMNKKGIYILFQFQQKNFNSLIGGFVPTNKLEDVKLDSLQIEKVFKEYFKDIPVRKSQNWVSYFDYWYYMNWTSNLNDLKNILFGNFKEDLKNKIEMLLKISES